MDRVERVARPVAPCPFYRMPCEYVPLANEAMELRAALAAIRDEARDHAEKLRAVDAGRTARLEAAEFLEGI